MMMQRIWAGILTAWAAIAIFAVLAFAQPAPPPTAGSATVMARAANGQLVPVTPSSGVHATTSSSGVPLTTTTAAAAQPVTYVKTASGRYVPVTSGSAGSPAAVTRSS